MYKVMLVDDDYPALEFLSEMIEWELLDLELQSIHENGASALAYALKDMPDILITDIGMPKMDGLELTERMKEQKADLQVAILSCHSEFKYAQKALKLNVQDYILKDTLDPEDLSALLLDIKNKLENNYKRIIKQEKLENVVERNKSLAKEKFLRELIYQSPQSNKEWCYIDNFSGFKLEKRPYIPILCSIEGYESHKNAYSSEDLFLFAVQNVITEVLKTTETEAVHFHFETNKSIILFPYESTLKMDSYGDTYNTLTKIQQTLKSYLNVSISFLVGENVAPDDLQFEISNLLGSKKQRFYMESSLITKKTEEISDTSEDIYSHYDAAAKELRQLIFEKEINNIKPFVNKWLQFIKEGSYEPDNVKEWVLKLLLELKLKLKSLQYFQSSFNMDIVHQEIINIENINDLRIWLIDCLDAVLQLTTEALYSAKNKEILEACVYVSLNIEKKLCLDEVANHLFLNPSYFSRLFKKETGKTFVEYVKTMKMERAKELLNQTTDTVGEICERLGYDNQSYFIKLFKNYTGITPAEYRGRKK
ncbi:helix-turn-helix domain-containing protein [Radiobacillus sp. PE A8.2]|uniref:response regulator transcription factor n=1 Tax=Radiobacillus sp. PE A8.2 TaxID=3380349 RepID=UPI0038908199